ncbi:MAG: hypothetical protein QOH35_3924 [Acidobacteriaceae bacterium]|nr:hypothetical protein [Acidobacteriaceae bacterium]
MLSRKLWGFTEQSSSTPQTLRMRSRPTTVNLGPGQRYGVIWPARKPGKRLIHCHISHHTANNNVEEHGDGELMLIIDVE